MPAKSEVQTRKEEDTDAATLPTFRSGNRLKVSQQPAPFEDSDSQLAQAIAAAPASLKPVSLRKPPRGAAAAPLLGPDQTRLGPYQLVCELASGGMATVYLALYRSVEGFEKLCAVKRIHPHLASDRAFANMFVDEAQIAARISHPFVCGVFSFGKTQKSHYIAMEFLRGEPLSVLSRRVARSPELGDDPRYPALAARLIANLAEGLHAAHTLKDNRGALLDVVHRDVTPQNLFVLYDGSVRVTDFGIAHARRRLHQTEGQKLKGKLSYIAPEQLDGTAVDLRVDVWGLGVVLWEMLAGRRLFLGASEGETLSAVMSRVVQPPSTFRASVPAELDRIVLRALERDLQKRYRNARDLSRDLERFLSASGDAMPAMDVADWMTRIFPEGQERIEALVELAAQVAAATADETVVRVPSGPPSKGPRAPQESWSSLVPPSMPSMPTVPDRLHTAATAATPLVVTPTATSADAAPATGKPASASDPKSYHISLIEDLDVTTLARERPAAEEASAAFELVRPRARHHFGAILAAGSALLVVAVLGAWHQFSKAQPSPRAADVAPPAALVQAADAQAPVAAPTSTTLTPEQLAPEEVAQPSPKAMAGKARQAAAGSAAPSSPSAPTAVVAQGDVFITTPGGSGDVFEHGRQLGRAPGVFRLPVGQHVLLLKPAQGAEHSISVNIAERTTTLVTVSLAP